MRVARAARVLGMPIGPDDDCERVSRASVSRSNTTRKRSSVTPPSYRFDLEIEEDLIEEVARIYGFERIPGASAARARDDAR